MGQHTHSMGAVQSSSSAQSQFDITVVDRATEQEHRLAVNPCEDIAESLQHSLGKFRVTRVVYGDSDVPLPLTWEGLGIADDTTKVYVDTLTKEQWLASAPRREAVQVVIDDILELNNGLNTFGLPLISAAFCDDDDQSQSSCDASGRHRILIGSQIVWQDEIGKDNRSLGLLLRSVTAHETLERSQRCNTRASLEHARCGCAC